MPGKRQPLAFLSWQYAGAAWAGVSANGPWTSEHHLPANTQNFFDHGFTRDHANPAKQELPSRDFAWRGADLEERRSLVSPVLLQRSTSEKDPGKEAAGDGTGSAIHFEDLSAEEDEQFLRREKRVNVRKGPLPKKTANRVKKGVIVAAVLALLGLVALVVVEYGMHSWRFRLESSDSIEIKGVQNASRAQVLDVVGEDIGKNVFFVDLEERRHKLEQIPWVESATVMRLLPNRLAISVQERTPVAFVRMGPRISLIDASGMVMGMPANKQVKYSFPVIQGIAETEPRSSRAAAMKIYNRLVRELDGEADDNGDEPKKAPSKRYMNDLSEIDLSDPEDVKVSANDAAGAVTIHLGSSDFLQRYKLYLEHIAEWRQQFPNLQSVDLRYEGQIIVNPDARKTLSEPAPSEPSKPVKQQVKRRARRR
ncbi:MAG TPA: FtsQ-type POTRA domain-containing protein [Candidatus Angelobacter sp.]|nr:FtsQ-type POTRA domain-containing protein [Candidatus Angelobacter sp.]